MIYPVVAVRDAKTTFWPCQVETNENSAIRNFAMMINSGSGVTAFAPGDFDLFKVATFDSEKGIVEPVFPIELICSGLNVQGVNYEK